MVLHCFYLCCSSNLQLDGPQTRPQIFTSVWNEKHAALVSAIRSLNPNRIVMISSSPSHQIAAAHPYKITLCTNSLPHSAARPLEEMYLTEKMVLNSLVFFPKMCCGGFFVCWVFSCHLLEIIASVSMLVSYVLNTHQAKLFKHNFVRAIFSQHINLKAEPISITAFPFPFFLFFSALWHGSRR